MATFVPFTKMHGAGNDYIYVNTLSCSIPDPAAAAIAWSDRHKGIGSDGLVLIGPADSADADFSMRIFNADGSEAMMCGNASRCIGKYLYEKGLTRQKVIRLQTLSGIKTLELHVEDGRVECVTVDMLAPRLSFSEQFLPELIDVEGTFVSMGNPHFVVFTDNVEALDIASLGSKLEYHKAFPQRCNIEFATVMSSNRIRTRVWERGSGITQACGTGACATAVAAYLTGRASRDTDIMMDGGTLHIHWNESDGHLYMTGPAAFVFEGEILLD